MNLNLNLYFSDRKLKALEKSKRNNKYVLAVITKILQNTPTKIWYHLDNNEYLKAAKYAFKIQNLKFITLKKINPLNFCYDLGSI